MFIPANDKLSVSKLHDSDWPSQETKLLLQAVAANGQRKAINIHRPRLYDVEIYLELDYFRENQVSLHMR